MSMHNRALATNSTDIFYPESDGKPMAETDVHRDLMMELIAELQAYYRAEPAVFVSGNLLLYYEQGNNKKSVAPDVFVVRGIANHERCVYKLWEEGKAPDVVFEISSRGTWGDDLQKKWRLYARLGVAEYYIFDPEYDYLEPALRAYRLDATEYEEIEVLAGRVSSAVLGLEIVDTGETLRFFNPLTNEFFPTRGELALAHKQAESRAVEAESRAVEAEAEVARLRAALALLKSEA